MKLCPECDTQIDGREWHCKSCGWQAICEDGFPLLAPDIAYGGIAYPTGSHDNLVQLEERNFWFVNRSRLILYLLNRFAPNSDKFLEIGCGTGYIMSELSKSRPDMIFFGVEAYLTGLKHAMKRLPEAEFAQMDACHLLFSEEFDVVGSFDVLEHIEEDQSALHQMYKALKPDGIIMVSVPQHPWLWSKTDEKAEHKRRYSKQDLLHKMEIAGFQEIFTASFISFSLPIMAVSRFATHLIPKKKNSKPQIGLRLPGFINIIFERVCRLELTMIQRGFTMPFGGSLVIVARKIAS